MYRDLSSLSSCNANINHNLYINVDDTCISMFSYAHRIKVVYQFPVDCCSNVVVDCSKRYTKVDDIVICFTTMMWKGPRG